MASNGMGRTAENQEEDANWPGYQEDFEQPTTPQPQADAEFDEELRHELIGLAVRAYNSPQVELVSLEAETFGTLRAAADKLVETRVAAMLRELSWEGPDESPEWFEQAIKARLAALPSEEAKAAAEGSDGK